MCFTHCALAGEVRAQRKRQLEVQVVFRLNAKALRLKP